MSRGGLVSFSTFSRPERTENTHIPVPITTEGFHTAGMQLPCLLSRGLGTCLSAIHCSSQVRSGWVCLSPKKGTRLTLDNQQDRVLSANSRGCSSSGSSPSSSTEPSCFALPHLNLSSRSSPQPWGRMPAPPSHQVQLSQWWTAMKTDRETQL